MFSSFFAGLSGMRTQQFQIEVLGNNLANAATVGYKGERATFSDLLSQTFFPGSAPSGSIGGMNPVQRGTGVGIGSLDRNFAQGNLEPTGRALDVALEGDGFFVLNDGRRDLYTRAGAFGLDSAGRLVDLRTGYEVRSVTGSAIDVNLNEVFPPRATQLIGFAGNLPAEVEGPRAEVLTTRAPLLAGTKASLVGTNTGPTFPLTNNSAFTIRVDGGAAQAITFIDSPTSFPGGIGNATAAQVVTYLNARLTGATASVDVSGAVKIDSNRKGATSGLDLDDGVGGPAAVLGLGTNLVNGTETTAVGTTSLSALTANTVEYGNGDRINITGREADGTSRSVQFVFGTDGTTINDLITKVNATFTSASAALNASGNIVFTANGAGEATLALSFSDETSATGRTTWSSHSFEVTTDGADPDEVVSTLDVVDLSGRTHTVTFTFTRDDSDLRLWHMAATIGNGEGTIVDGEARGISFNDDGSFSSVTGTGTGDADIEIVWTGLSGTQTMSLGFGTPGEFDGLTELGDERSAAAVDQDGFQAGSLSSLSVRGDGVLEGRFTNGQARDLGQLGLALFANPGGLLRVGDSLFAVSGNSGDPQSAQAGSGRAGRAVGGALEASNVDVTDQMVRLIESQRAFQASSRTVITADTLVQEVLNLVR